MTHPTAKASNVRRKRSHTERAWPWRARITCHASALNADTPKQLATSTSACQPSSRPSLMTVRSGPETQTTTASNPSAIRTANALPPHCRTERDVRAFVARICISKWSWLSCPLAGRKSPSFRELTMLPQKPFASSRLTRKKYPPSACTCLRP